MKTLLMILGLCLLVSFQSKAQRYLPGQKGFQLTYGSVDDKPIGKFKDNFHCGFKYSVYTKKKNRWLIGAEYLQKQYNYKEATIPKEQYTAEGGYYLNFLAAFRQTVFLSVGASALAGYETSNKNDKILFDGATLKNDNCFVYGGALSLEIEIFPCNQIALLLYARERMLKGSDIGKFHSQLGVGVKFIIN